MHLLPLPAQLVPIAAERMRAASDVIRDRAAAAGAICIDVWTRPDGADAAFCADDRSQHPNAKGHHRIAASFAELLRPAIST